MFFGLTTQEKGVHGISLKNGVLLNLPYEQETRYNIHQVYETNPKYEVFLA